MELLRGKKLRAWNQLCAAAAEHPDYYLRWIAAAEPLALQNWCADPEAASPTPRVLALIAGDEDTQNEKFAKTRASLLRAFADRISVEAVALGTDLAGAMSEAATDIDWILPIAAGDTVAPSLGGAFDAARARSPEALAHYWDEDRITSDRRHHPWLKPSWDEILFAACPGLFGAAIFHRSAVSLALPVPLPDDSAAMARWVGRMGSDRICHIPLILTHRAEAPAGYHPVAPESPSRWPSLSIIIPMRDKPELLRNCLGGLGMLEYAGPVETIIVDNGSSDPKALALLEDVEQREDVTVIRMPGAFNFSRLNNAAARIARGEILCLLNNDIEPLDGAWLARLVAHANAKQVGAVGALLLYPDLTVQHAGVAIGLGDAAGHVQRGVAMDCAEDWHWAFATRQVSAVTGACLVVSRAKYLAVGGLDEEVFAVAFNDVDFCLKLDRAGYRNIYVAEARLIHHESKSRGLDDVPEKAARFRRELLHLKQRWNTQSVTDPHFSPLFSRASERCVLSL